MPPDRFSHSSLATWRRCRYRYYLLYIKNYKPHGSPGQFRGTIGHAALAEWYKNEYDDDKALKVASDITTSIEQENSLDLSKDWEEMEFVLRRYFGWARYNDKFEVISTELEYEIDIDGIKLMGFIDGIVRQNKGVWILEHKFNKQVSLSHIDLDMQVSIYMLAAQKLGYNPSGCLYNVIRMGERGIAATEPVVRKLAYRNLEGLRVIEYELSNQMRELMKFNKEEHLPIYRNPTKDCHWDCPFYNACLSLNDSGEAESVLGSIPIDENRGFFAKTKGETDE